MPLSATLTTNVQRDETLAESPRPSQGTTPASTPNTISFSSNSTGETTQSQAIPNHYASSAAVSLPEWQSSPGNTGGGATAALEAASEPKVLMSTMGFGIDLGHNGNTSFDATEASLRAVRDAMERSTLRLPTMTALTDASLHIHVKLGVPSKRNSLTVQPMPVDMNTIGTVLPSSIPHSVKVVVGGLSVDGFGADEPPVCAAVASITIQAATSEAAPVAQRTFERGTWGQLDQPSPPPTTLQQPRLHPALAGATRRVDSMDMLARISEAVRENPNIVEGPFAAAVAVARDAEAASSSSDSALNDNNGDGSSVESIQEDEDSNNKKSSILLRKRKLPAGLTRLKNERRFVEHDYHDHANDEPESGEDIDGPVGDTIPFPFKMHDILSRIEADGLSDIMSWMPHGRSFKIHDLDGFHEQILPRYFRHTKKSSLLRQLNLYGFNRICAGPDKGSYYHELFLRGKRFLCHRMRRVKVNGKRIRSAGNPDTEPCFLKMDPMPLVACEYPPSAMHTVSSDVSDDDVSVMEETAEDSQEQTLQTVPHSYELMSFPFKLQCMLDQLESLGKTDVISWQSHGRSFRVHKPEQFVQELMPTYFKMSKFSSFQRNLHMYSFQRFTQGPDRNHYYHPQFLRRSPHLIFEMKRTRINGKGCRRPADPATEPDLHELPPIPVIPLGSKLDLPAEMPDPTELEL